MWNLEFDMQGPLKELVESLQKEMEGEFLKDCLQVGAGDLMGLVQILKDLASQYTDGHQELWILNLFILASFGGLVKNGKLVAC